MSPLRATQERARERDRARGWSCVRGSLVFDIKSPLPKHPPGCGVGNGAAVNLHVFVAKSSLYGPPACLPACLRLG